MKKLLLMYLMILCLVLLSGAVTKSFARDVTLLWDANTETNLKGYIVYWGIVSKSYDKNSGNIGLDTTYNLNIPDDNKTYYFAVTAVNTAGLESDYSNEVNTSEADGSIDNAKTPPGKPSGLKMIKLVFTATDGTKYKVEGQGENLKLTITKPDGTIVVVQ